jgi:hypothetical protein
MRIAALDSSLREASKAREQRLRRAPIEYRAVMAFEMLDMDKEVMSFGRELAMCTLDVQLDYLYIALEEELRQILDSDPSGERGLEDEEAMRKLAPRRGSTEELGLLLAQYALLSRRQAALQDVLSVRVFDFLLLL